MRRLNLILLGLALIFLVWMLHEVGWQSIWQHLLQVGWWWPVLLLPYGVVTWLEAVSWDYLLLSPTPRPSLARLFRLRLSGEALNTLTPTAGLGGEPFKASRLVALGLPWEEATASVVIHKGVTILSLVLYIFLGLALVPFILPLNGSLAVFLGLGAFLLATGALLFVLVQGRGPCMGGVRLLERLGLCPRVLKEKEAELASLDAAMAYFYRQHPGRGFLSLALFFLAWLTHAVEVYVIFWLLGHPISWGLAVCLDALAMLFTALGFFIPASLGVQDGGNVLLALGFHLGATLGAAFSILRRLREAFWMG
ncbi:MAG: flippase-like domain-containing protein, partial [Thermodesulfobacteriota bacterium]